jgi:hypothetical protein
MIKTVKLYTLQRLGASPRDCLVVEDSVIGLQVDLVICNCNNQEIGSICDLSLIYFKK